MKLEKLSLLNFRNHVSLNLDFSSLTSVIVGPNASGKTNVLEAIYLLATGDSFREGKIEERVGFEVEVAHVAGKISNQILRQSGALRSTRSAQDDKLALKSLTNLSNEEAGEPTTVDDLELRVVLTRGLVQGKKVAKRRLLVNGVGRSKQKFVGNLTVVVFRPEDLRIIEGSPSRRRKFLDEVLSQADWEYARSLGSYNKALVRRNKLLQMIREGKTTRSALLYWDHLLLKEGEVVQRKRREMTEFFCRNKQQVTSNKNKSDGFLDNLQMEYECSVISPTRLKQYEDNEVWAGHTLVGPHRDDFVVSSKTTDKKQQATRDLAVYGSRGEQRLGVMWLKAKSMEYLEQVKGERPVLLLDDIFSELDHEHRKLVEGVLGKQQTIMTTADKHYVEGIEVIDLMVL